MNRKQQTLLIAGTVLSILWIFLFLFSAHVSIVKILSPDLNLSQAWSAAGSRMFSPSFFKIFPVPKRTYVIMFIGPMVLSVFAGMILLTRREQAHEDKKTALTKNSWATEKDMKEYARECTAPVNSTKKDLFKNVIIGQDVYLGLDHRETGKNVHSVIVAGSGRGKTWRYVVPNLLLGSTSYVVTDPSGEIYRDYGSFFERMGYRIKVLNLAHMESSNHYNPFHYISRDEDVALLTEILIANTTPKDTRASDPFWQNAEMNFLNSAMLLIYKYYAPEDRHMDKIMDLIRMSNLSEEDENGGGKDKNAKQKKKDGMDEEFDRYRVQDPEGAAFRFYDAFRAGAARTKMSILQSVTSRLHHFNFDNVINLTSYDEMELDTIGDMKTIVFVITPANSKTYNFIAAMLYSQLFIRLYDYCETTAGFGTIVRDANGEVLRTFRADSEKDAKRVAAIAENYAEEIKECQLVYNDEMKWHEVRTKNNELVAYRKLEKDAEAALEAAKNASVEKGKERLPIHVRFMMDEFSNVASIPDFDNKISVCRKYEMSFAIIIQSLKQIQERYKDVWDVITANADSCAFMGTGCDEVTEKWFSTQCGKTTKQIANQSFNKNGGGMSVAPQLVDLVTPADLRTLKKNEMIILMSGVKPYRGKMYNTANHPNYKLVKGKYRFDRRKAMLFVTENRKFEKRLVKPENAGEVKRDVKDVELLLENLNRANRILAEEYRVNADMNGEPVIGAPCKIQLEKDTLKTTCGIKTEEDVQEAANSLVKLNRKLYEVYSEIRRLPHDRRRIRMNAS